MVCINYISVKRYLLKYCDKVTVFIRWINISYYAKILLFCTLNIIFNTVAFEKKNYLILKHAMLWKYNFVDKSKYICPCKFEEKNQPLHGWNIDDTALNSIQTTNQLKNKLYSLRKETKRFTVFIYLIVFIYLSIFSSRNHKIAGKPSGIKKLE